jgi:putative PIN family toxin of toxin-antitoxin system
LWALKRLEVFASPEILGEYRRVLTRKRGVNPVPELDRWVDFMRARVRIVQPVRRVALCRDPDDDKFLDCALAARVDCLVSGDGDLRALGEVEGIPILGPGAFLRCHQERLGLGLV